MDIVVRRAGCEAVAARGTFATPCCVRVGSALDADLIVPGLSPYHVLFVFGASTLVGALGNACVIMDGRRLGTAPAIAHERGVLGAGDYTLTIEPTHANRVDWWGAPATPTLSDNALERSLHAALLADPEDLETIAVYADLLEEKGQLWLAELLRKDGPASARDLADAIKRRAYAEAAPGKGDAG